MGSLGGTMDKLTKLSPNRDTLANIEKKVKADLYAIAAAVEKKQGDKVLEAHRKATDDIVAYIEAL